MSILWDITIYLFCSAYKRKIEKALRLVYISGSVFWLHCQKIAGLEYWVRLLLNFTLVSVRQV